MARTSLKLGSAPPKEAVGRVLERTSLEIVRALELIESSHDVVSRALDAAKLTEDDVRAYQGLDRAIQSLGAVSEFLLAMKTQLPDRVTISPETAATSLALHDVASRLKGLGSASPEPDDEIMLFV